MKYNYFSLLILFFLKTNAQFISVDHLAYSDQLLIEEILFGNSTCVEDIQVFNTVSGNFQDGMKSYGYFTTPSNSSFPFENGIVLSTGRLDNTEGPNDSLSDDDAPGWGGDQDLRDALNIPDNEVLINATSIRFYFTPKASQLSFEYIFASEEYQENNANTCIFSDVFAFLIRPMENGQPATPFENIALVPNTNIPVKVTTVRPEIPTACPAENEEWFGQFNQSNGADAISPTKFNGQTKVLTAIANVVPNQEYEVKLVIADEANYRYDSAVFINGGSFEVGVNLGLNRIDDRAICEGDEVILDVSDDNPIAVNWLYNGNIVAQNQNSLTVAESNFGAGLYAVEVTLANGCIATDEIEIQFQSNEIPDPFNVVTCGEDGEVNVTYDLLSIENEVLILPNNFYINSFYQTENDAINQENAIDTPTSFLPNSSLANAYVRLENAGGCELIVPIILQRNGFEYEALQFTECPDDHVSELSFNVNQLRNTILNYTGEQVDDIVFFPSRVDALQNTNQILADNFFVAIEDFPTTYIAKLLNPGECQGVVPIEFRLIETPVFESTVTDLTLCRSDDFISLAPQLASSPENIEYEWNTGETTPSINVTEAGVYTLVATRNSLDNGQVITCSNIIQFTVEEAGFEDFEIIITGQPNETQTAVAQVFPEGNYSYSLNDENSFQSNNTFRLSQIENIIYVRDLDGCGEASRRFTVLQIPAFFTPNADGINDVWRPRGFQNEAIELERVQIFDRYGKLLIRFGPGGFWDGTFNGNLMPPNDYWYRINLSHGREFTGNFTLKR